MTKELICFYLKTINQILKNKENLPKIHRDKQKTAIKNKSSTKLLTKLDIHMTWIYLGKEKNLNCSASYNDCKCNDKMCKGQGP